jgi:hypothetical protein
MICHQGSLESHTSDRLSRHPTEIAADETLLRVLGRRHLTNVAADKHFSDAASPQW